MQYFPTSVIPGILLAHIPWRDSHWSRLLLETSREGGEGDSKSLIEWLMDTQCRVGPLPSGPRSDRESFKSTSTAASTHSAQASPRTPRPRVMLDRPVFLLVLLTFRSSPRPCPRSPKSCTSLQPSINGSARYVSHLSAPLAPAVPTPRLPCPWLTPHDFGQYALIPGPPRQLVVELTGARHTC